MSFSNRQARELLVKRHPLAFFTGSATRKPLEHGALTKLEARNPDIPLDALRRALIDYKARPEYLAGLVSGCDRINLDGQPHGVVTRQEADHAGRQLVERFRVKALRDIREEAARLASMFVPLIPADAAPTTAYAVEATGEAWLALRGLLEKARVFA